MNAARVELKLVLDQAGMPQINLETFSQRFNLQKRIYLVQLMGYDLGYRFGWYIRGPYSPALTADAFTLRDELQMGETDHEAYTLAGPAVERIQTAEKLWEAPPGLAVSNDEWLELLASVHYLKHIAYWPKGAKKDFDEIFQALVEAKPRFTNARNDAFRAWQRLEQFGLIAAKKRE